MTISTFFIFIAAAALEVAKRICRAVALNTQGNCDIPSVTVSIGVATFPSCADNVLSLFSAADDALERAQSQGRNQAALAPPRSVLASSVSHTVSTPTARSVAGRCDPCG